mmetsp:Transcript_17547/g.43163  ORF Transcript_17547/g.43163 Transcript_17547/m.43163 type:complete len:231 (-) Transcript_17547:69-761(-)
MILLLLPHNLKVVPQCHQPRLLHHHQQPQPNLHLNQVIRTVTARNPLQYPQELHLLSQDPQLGTRQMPGPCLRCKQLRDILAIRVCLSRNSNPVSVYRIHQDHSLRVHLDHKLRDTLLKGISKVYRHKAWPIKEFHLHSKGCPFMLKGKCLVTRRMFSVNHHNIQATSKRQCSTKIPMRRTHLGILTNNMLHSNKRTEVFHPSNNNNSINNNHRSNNKGLPRHSLILLGR